MAKLILSMDGLTLKEIPLNKERMMIGRKPHNDIQIDNLAISGEHAVVVTILNDCFLEDLGSTNGTMVNGQAVKKHFLQNNDVIELGKYRLKFVAEVAQAPAAANNDFEKTMVLRPGAARPAPPPPQPPSVAAPADKSFGDTQVGMASAKDPMSTQASGPPTVSFQTATASAAPAAAPKPAGLPLGAIQVLSGSNSGKEMELTKTLTTLGKPGVQVAVISRRPQGYFITHVEGAQFPIVNGKTLDSQAQLLNDHDVIELASVKMSFFIKG